MPLYDFLCKICDHIFEIKAPLHYEEIPKCPKCGKNTYIKKLIAPPGIIFKGSGFYKTDSRAENEKQDKKVDVNPVKQDNQNKPDIPKANSRDDKK